MKRRVRITRILLRSFATLLPVTAAVISFGCGGLELQSVWSNEGVKIDGVAANWRDSLWVEKDGIKFAVMNDNEYLYLAVVAAKPDLRRQIMMRGLTVWFDPDSREKKNIGIRYPIGMTEGGDGYRREESYAQSSMSSPMAEFEFVSPFERDRMRVPVIAGRGVQLKINNEQESLLYELRVPLHSSTDHPYSAETTAGSKIGVGVEVGGVSRGSAGDRGGEGEGGGIGGGGRRGGGGRGRGSGGGSRSRPPGSISPIEVWATVQLTARAK